MAHPTSERGRRLARFRAALLDALASMPAGYEHAVLDRNRYAAPVEEIVMALDKEIGDDHN